VHKVRSDCASVGRPGSGRHNVKSSTLSPTDILLASVDKDVKRTHLVLALFAQPIYPHPSCPLSPPGEVSQDGPPYISNRRIFFDRMDLVNPQGVEGLRERSPQPDPRNRDSASSSTSFTRPKSSSSVSSTNSPPSPSVFSEGSPHFSARPPTDRECQPDFHWEAVERLLFVYATLNPGIGYIQGMNEIVSPLYHAFAQDSRKDEACHAEADAFTCFTNLMAQLRDIFESIDIDGEEMGAGHAPVDATTASRGIGRVFQRLVNQLRWLDPELESALEDAGITPFHYAFRWCLTLFGQTFAMPELSRILDSIFSLLPSNEDRGRSDEEGFSPAVAFIVDFACAMILSKRAEIYGSSFTTATRALQNFKDSDLDVLLQVAYSIRERRISSYLTGDSPSLIAPGDETGGASLRLARMRLAGAVSSPTANNLRRFLRRDGADVAAHEDNQDFDQSSSSPPAVNVTPPTANTGFFSKYASAFADSDAAASLYKASTNARIVAGRTASSWRTQAPAALGKISSNFNSPTNPSKSMFARPSSPTRDPPFLPPIDDDDPNGKRWFSTPPRPSPEEEEASPPSGHKPLWLSTVARRRAANGSSMDLVGSPNTSRRSSVTSATSESLAPPGSLYEASPSRARSASPRPISPSGVLHYRSSSSVTPTTTTTPAKQIHARAQSHPYGYSGSEDTPPSSHSEGFASHHPGSGGGGRMQRKQPLPHPPPIDSDISPPLSPPFNKSNIPVFSGKNRERRAFTLTDPPVPSEPSPLPALPLAAEREPPPPLPYLAGGSGDAAETVLSPAELYSASSLPSLPETSEDFTTGIPYHSSSPRNEVVSVRGISLEDVGPRSPPPPHESSHRISLQDVPRSPPPSTLNRISLVEEALPDDTPIVRRPRDTSLANPGKGGEGGGGGGGLSRTRRSAGKGAPRKLTSSRKRNAAEGGNNNDRASISSRSSIESSGRTSLDLGPRRLYDLVVDGAEREESSSGGYRRKSVEVKRPEVRRQETSTWDEGEILDSY
jgi:hypothetical protein